jgi:hypothetical protein
MHRTRTIGALILAAVGLIWIGQGTGLLRGRSFMVGDPLWSVLGLVAVVLGLVVVFAELRRAR